MPLRTISGCGLGVVFQHPARDPIDTIEIYLVDKRNGATREKTMEELIDGDGINLTAAIR
jgi:hypothetical protein